MKRILTGFLTAAIGLGIFSGVALPALGAEPSYTEVATDEEQMQAQEVGVEGMEPVYGSDIVDGVYEVEVEVSSSMFPVEKAELTVKDGEMTAVLTMGVTGYLKLFMGTGREAAGSDVSAYIDFEVDENGKHTYTIPVEALDMPISCAAFSKNREKWYDRSVLFLAGSLPKEAVLVELPDYEALKKAAREKRIAAMREEKEGADGEAGENGAGASGEHSGDPGDPQDTAPLQPAFIELEDGEYAITVELTGGTGRTAVTSPAPLFVTDGLAYAQIEWSSTSYDYMIVGGEKFFPIHEEGYSTFLIPIPVFDEPVPVVADTTAMSVPHEIDYELTFVMSGVVSKNATPRAAAQRMVYMVFVIIALCGVVSYINKRRRNSVK